MSLCSAEAKQAYFLTAEDLKALPRETFYGGFGSGRAAYLFNEDDLEAAAIAKHGEAGYAKKKAARKKREENKRKRAEAVVAAEAEKESARRDELAADPALAKREAVKKQRREAKTAAILERNAQIVGEQWDLTIVTPERVAGTKATLQIKQLPPDGWPGDSSIDCDDVESPAYSFGNIHGFKGKSCEKDAEMVFETKWKVCGTRHTGKLSVRVQSSDKPNAVKEKAGEIADKTGSTEIKHTVEESLMVTGKFDSGVNGGVRRWSFKEYR